MSSASLAVSRRTHPDQTRIAAISAAIALNLAVILIASRPSTPAALPLLQRLENALPITFIQPSPPIPPPPPVEMLPRPHPPLAPVAIRPQPLPAAPPVAAPAAEGNVAAPPVSAPTLQPAGGTVGTAPVEASLAYRSAPLRFPARALQQRMQGTVLLRVLVDESGKPQQVLVEHGSGYALLDRSAVEQVLAGWLFQPATVDGRAVRAWARVPVTFNLREY